MTLTARELAVLQTPFGPWYYDRLERFVAKLRGFGIQGRGPVSGGRGIERGYVTPDGGVYFDFEDGALPSSIKGDGTITNTISNESFFGSHSWLSDGGGSDDMAYVEIDGNTHSQIYAEVWWRNPLDGRVDFIEGKSSGDTSIFDFFNEGNDYFHFDGSRRKLFDIDPNAWFLTELYLDESSDFIEIEVYDTSNNLVASRTDDSAFRDTPEPMVGVGSKNEGNRLYIDEIFVISGDYRGNERVVQSP